MNEVQKKDLASAPLRLIAADLAAPCYYEESCKVVAGGILDDRFLLSFHKRYFGADPFEALSRYATELALPLDFLDAIREGIKDALFIHVGFERELSRYIYKVYLENPRVLQSTTPKSIDPCSPVLLYTGYKWDPLSNTMKALTQYNATPGLRYQELTIRFEELFPSNEHPNMVLALSALLRFVSTKIDLRSLLFLDVTEDGSERRSFDLNLYDAKIEIREAFSYFRPLLDTLKIPDLRQKDLFQSHKEKRLGHIAGGIGRNGDTFLTLYFGARACENSSTLFMPGI